MRLSPSSNEAIRDLVASSIGLGVLSRHALAADPARDGLVLLGVEGFPLRHMWNVVHLRARLLPLPAQAFLEEPVRVAGTDSGL
jgi:DNA-binding transcriptional LysR family regulator